MRVSVGSIAEIEGFCMI